MYVITAHQRYGQTDRQTDVKRSHDRYIAKACSGKNQLYELMIIYFSLHDEQQKQFLSNCNAILASLLSFSQ